MAYPFQPWRAAMVPASFMGAGFYVESGGQASGRRGPTHEFPMQDVPYTEDLGRRARRWPITAYVIGPDYLDDRDSLIAACETQGPGTLVHPTLGDMQVRCDTYSVVETRERGGMATFEMVFVEAGELPNGAPATDTQAQATSAANNLGQTAASSMDTATKPNNSAGSAPSTSTNIG